MNEKGRWFRVYARQVDEHPKFAALTGIELGAWMALRSEAELRDRAMLRSEADAVLILRRRKIPRPAHVLARLIDLRLFDVDENGRITVHDRADHDRPQYPSDSPEAAAERQRRSRADRAGHEDVTTRDGNGHDTHAGVQPQQATPAPANSLPPQPTGAGLPADDDSATAACRYFLNGGRWLDDDEYVAAWVDLDRRFTSEWVKAVIQPAYSELFAINPKVKPWDLLRRVEFLCAEKARSEDRKREERIAEEQRQESERLRSKAEAATEEDRRRATITRRAIGLWIKRRPNDPVPSDFDELEAWLNENEGQAAA